MKEELNTPEAGAESEIARLQANRIEGDFGYLDVQALRGANEQPAIKDYARDLQAKLGEMNQMLEDLRSSVMKGEHKTDDIQAKVAFEKTLDSARFKVHHVFAQPEAPSRVQSQQASLENATDNFQQRFVQRAEIMSSALAGEQSSSEIYPGEMSKEYNVGNILKNLSPERLTELQAKVSATLEKLHKLQPQIEEIASKKALPPDEKDEFLKNYGRAYEEYQKTRDELRQLLRDVEKAGK